MCNQTVICKLVITTCEIGPTLSLNANTSSLLNSSMIVVGLFQRYFLLEKGILKYSKTHQDVSDQI